MQYAITTKLNKFCYFKSIILSEDFALHEWLGEKKGKNATLIPKHHKKKVHPSECTFVLLVNPSIRDYL